MKTTSDIDDILRSWLGGRSGLGFVGLRGGVGRSLSAVEGSRSRAQGGAGEHGRDRAKTRPIRDKSETGRLLGL